MTEVAFLVLALATAVLPINTARPRLHSLGHPTVRWLRKNHVWHGRFTFVFLAVTAVTLPGAVFVGPAAGLSIGLAFGISLHWWFGRSSRKPAEETAPWQLAAGWDLLAAGMRAGLPVPTTVRAAAAEFSGMPRKILLQVADLLSLGADPVEAWEPALRHPDTAGCARAARRMARTGSALADIAADLATQARAAAREQVQIRAQRASVWVTAPLGLCFLPAFLCLGIVPVVAGMVHRLAVLW